MNSPTMDARWWVTMTVPEGPRKGRKQRMPFEDRANAVTFVSKCLEAGIEATMTAPRNPIRPWESL